MRFWQSLSFTETDQLVDLARICEEVGFHGVLVSDHVFHPEKIASRYPYSEDGAPPFDHDTEWPDPWAAIAAMATVTERLRFGTGVYILPLRHPLQVAKSLATAACLSGNRTMLGIGTGWIKEEFDQFGVDFGSRGRRTDEMIDVIRKILAGGMVEHHGDFFDFDRLRIEPVPSEPVPICVGGAAPPALRRAARRGDGWIGAGNHPDEVPAILETLNGLRVEAGRESLPFDAIVPLTVPPDLDQLRRLEDLGMTSTLNYPLAYALGGPSSLEAKRGVLEQYGEQVIARAR